MDRIIYGLKRVLLCGVFTVGALAAAPLIADTTNPGWINKTAELISPDDAKAILTKQKTAALVLAQSAAASVTAAASSDYQQLAAALENDPLRIYQFVRNNFEYVPYYGALKGAYLTLLERSGNDFDQAALLVKLLRAAGYTAHYQYGTMDIPLSAANGMGLATWLGAQAESVIIKKILSGGGIPAVKNTRSFTMDRVWVVVDITGTRYALDPAFKPSTQRSRIDLPAVMGYSQTALLAAAGGVKGTDSISHLNQDALESYLDNLTHTLATHLKQNHFNAQVSDIVGGKNIVPDHSNRLPVALPFAGTPTEPQWAEIPPRYVHTIRIAHGDINITQDIPNIAGKKLSITYTDTTPVAPPPPDATDFGTVGIGRVGAQYAFGPATNMRSTTVWMTATLSGSNAFSFASGGGEHQVAAKASISPKVEFSGVNQTAGRKHATLTIVTKKSDGTTIGKSVNVLTGAVQVIPLARIHLDDQLLVAETRAIGNTDTLELTVDHPYAADSGTFADERVIFNLNRFTGHYVLASGFGGDRHSQLLTERQRLLNEMTRQGLANDTREVLTETLNVIGQTWMQQTQLNTELIGAVSEHRMLWHHRFGMVSQEAGYYVDMRAQWISLLPESFSALKGGFKADSFVASAMEHSVLEQLQGIDNPAISTIKIFALNNRNGDKFFLAKKMSADKTNFAAIRPQLRGYTPEELTGFKNAVTANHTLILPQNGQVALNDWKGKGYVKYQVNNSSLGMLIGGGLHGGFSSRPAVVNTPKVQAESIAKNTPPATIQRQTAGDPVDLNSGAFFTQMTDIRIAGSGARGLSFTRFYNSHQANQDTAGLGKGWTHNQNIYLTKHSDVEAGLGMRTPLDAAALIVSAIVTRDLMEPNQPALQAWIVSALVANWATNQLLDNAISVHIGDQVLTFLQQPDGRYNPPPGVTTQLVKLSDGTFELRERFGTVITFNSANKIASFTDIDGNKLTYTYTGNKLTEVKDTYNRPLTLHYTNDQLTSVNDQNGRTISYTQAGDDLTEVIGLENANWTYSYDTQHQLKTVINPVGITLVDNTYDATGKVILQKAPRVSGTVSYHLYYTGLSSAEEDPLGHRTTYHYNLTGRTVAIEDAAGHRTTAAYDGQGQTTQQSDARGHRTTHRYDRFNNRIKTTNALTQATDFTYDSQHRLTQMTDALNHTTEIDYDTHHHPIATRDGEGNQATTTYRANGQVATQTDPRLTQTTYSYDSNGYPKTTKTHTQPAVTTVYDAIGRMTHLSDQAGTQTRFTHDDRGRITERIDPLNRKTLTTYDPLGRITRQTDRNGQSVTTGYTASGKLDTLNYPNHSVRFNYDSRDNLTTMTDPTGITHNTFDALNRLTGTTDPNGFQVQYSYDATGNLTQLTYPGNKSVRYSYDALNRINGITLDWLNLSATPSYDAAGRVTGIRHFNGTGTTYSYDKANRLTGLTHKTNNQTLLSYAYTLNASGNRIKSTTTHAPTLPNGLITHTRQQTYNSLKNRLEQSVVNGTITPYRYDNEGQIQSKGNTNYRFDSAHRLTSWANNNYQYDGMGNRLIATRDGITTKYIYDASGNLLAEANAANEIERYYIHGLGLMAMVDAKTNKLYVYHFDGTGHTVAMTDETQTLINQYGYTPFGKLRGKIENIPQPFTYVGQYGVMTEADNLYYMRARYYDAQVGRFISEDPIGFAGGLNLYAYVGGNPVNVVDPSGLCPWCVGAVIGGTANALSTYFGGGSAEEVATAFGVGALTGAVFVATGGAAGGSLGAWMATGAATGAITGGGTAIANGHLSEAGTAAISGALIGAVTGGIGQRLAVANALQNVRSGLGAASSVRRGDLTGNIGGAASSVGLNLIGK